MFTRENIDFEDSLLIDSIVDNPELLKKSIVDSIFILASEMAKEIGIKSLSQIVIRRCILFDGQRGSVNRVDGELQLSYKTAINLTRPENAKKYSQALITLRHELIHLYDREMLYLKLCQNSSHNVEAGYSIWTEFHATYSTFDIMEDMELCDDFETVFTKGGDKKYYLSRLLGYYLHSEHSKRCEQLINYKIGKQTVLDIVKILKKMIVVYPQIPADDLVVLNETTEAVLNKPMEFGREISILELIKKAKKE